MRGIARAGRAPGEREARWTGKVSLTNSYVLFQYSWSVSFPICMWAVLCVGKRGGGKREREREREIGRETEGGRRGKQRGRKKRVWKRREERRGHPLPGDVPMETERSRHEYI